MDNILEGFILSAPEIERPKGLTSKIIHKLNDACIERYRGLIDSGSPSVRVGECQRYLQIHQAVRACGHSWGKMSKLGKSEIYDEYVEEYGTENYFLDGEDD